MYIVQVGESYIATAPEAYKKSWSWFLAKPRSEATVFPRMEEALAALSVRFYEEGRNAVLRSSSVSSVLILKVKTELTVERVVA